MDSFVLLLAYAILAASDNQNSLFLSNRWLRALADRKFLNKPKALDIVRHVRIYNQNWSYSMNSAWKNHASATN